MEVFETKIHGRMIYRLPIKRRVLLEKDRLSSKISYKEVEMFMENLLNDCKLYETSGKFTENLPQKTVFFTKSREKLTVLEIQYFVDGDIILNPIAVNKILQPSSPWRIKNYIRQAVGNLLPGMITEKRIIKIRFERPSDFKHVKEFAKVVTK